MRSDEVFDSEILHNALEDALSTVTVAEAHGSLCGLLCTPPNEDAYRAWSEHVLGGDPSVQSRLDSFRVFVERELESDEFSFEPLLRDDEHSLDERATALVEWCAGFLFGFGLGHGQFEGLPADGLEFVNDLKDICRLSVPEEPEEDDERSYSELVEYVRVGTMLMRQLRRGPLI